MKLFVHTPEFKAMNVGFGLDEGIAGPKEVMPLFYGERNVFWIKVNSNDARKTFHRPLFPTGSVLGSGFCKAKSGLWSVMAKKWPGAR